MNAPISTWYHQRLLRVIAGVSLAAALVMLVLGGTKLEPYLEGTSFIIWWGIVFCLVVLAFIMATLDLADLRRRLAADKKRLLRTYLLDKKFLGDLEEKIGEQQKKQGAGETPVAQKDSEAPEEKR